MIVVKIIGGLGNQMFQYALGRRIAYLNDETLKLDLSGFETYDLHNYSLNHFNIREDIAAKNDLRSFRGSNNKYLKYIIRMMNRKGLYLPYIQKGRTICERSIDYDSSILDNTADIYLDG
ncbi:MAG: hypothetical protein ACOYCB_12025, partial [Fastidiosipilaceae bacterium]